MGPLLGVLALLVIGAAAITSNAGTGPRSASSTPSPAPASPSAPCGVLQSRITAAPARTVLDLSGCTYAAGATIDKPLTLEGATIRPPAGSPGLTITADDVTLLDLHILGPGGTALDALDSGIYVDANPGAPVRNLVIQGSEVADFSYAGVYLRFVANVSVTGNHVHDIVYAGLMVLSGQGGTISGNTIQRIGVGRPNGTNAYGVALSRIEGSLASNPITQDFLVSQNTVTDVPTWHAFDTHAGQHIAFTDNTLYRVSRGIFVTTDGDGNRPRNIIITGNLLGSPAPVTFNLYAVTIYEGIDVTVAGNSWSKGWEGNYLEDMDGRSTGLAVSGNKTIP